MKINDFEKNHVIMVKMRVINGTTYALLAKSIDTMLITSVPQKAIEFVKKHTKFVVFVGFNLKLDTEAGFSELDLLADFFFFQKENVIFIDLADSHKIKKDVTFDQIKNVTFPNVDLLNQTFEYDTLILYKLYNLCKSDIVLKLKLIDEYQLNLKPTLTNKLNYSFEKILYNGLKKDKDVILKLKFSNELRNLIRTNSDLCNQMIKLEKIDHNTIIKKFYYLNNGIKINFNYGGIKYVDPLNKKFTTNDEYQIFVIDFEKFFPNLIVKYDCASRMLKLDLYNKLVENRKNELDKLMINSVYGLQGYNYSKLYDPEKMYQTALTGQLILLYLIDLLLANELISEKMHIIQINSDGFFVKIKKDYINYMLNTINGFEQKSDLKLTVKKVQFIYQLNMNDYVAKIENKIVVKGNNLCSNYRNVDLFNKRYPIIDYAIYQHLVNNVSIEQTINTNTNVKLCLLLNKSRDEEMLFNGQKYDNLVTYPAKKGNDTVYLVNLVNYYGNQRRSPNQSISSKIYDDKVTIDDVDKKFLIEKALKIMGKF